MAEIPIDFSNRVRLSSHIIVTIYSFDINKISEVFKTAFSDAISYYLGTLFSKFAEK